MRKYWMMATMAMMVAGCGLAPQAAHAQAAIEGRVDRLESEMRAVQRKVFPGGRDQFVQPENTPSSPNMALPGSPSDSPVADLDARVNALETQMTGMTGQIETTQHRVQLLEDAFNAYKRSTDARLKALEENASAVGTTPGAIEAPGTTLVTPARPVTRPVTTPVTGGATGTTTGTRPPATATRPATATKDPARAAKVAAVERPVSDDPAEDAYLYGYRLWQAKLFPEAEAQFKTVVATYPKHKRASYAQNLLGRSYLDEDKPSLASIAFYDNYKKMPDGDRAPDSLYYLAQALMKLGKPADACKVYGELSDVYGSKIADPMKADIARGRTEAKCK
jgi:TolA-binding protein